MGQPEKDSDRHPDPDALLALANRERHGKLRVFLGAAPGVGKTYAMLARARALKADGVDIVIGLVETHGRRETEFLLQGQDILPRREIQHRGMTIEEFDIDAALSRKPQFIVVDELAHTNAPDSRHPKRWQDVEELLGAGINVWTALNIQHLESLGDVISHITGVAMHETVPDRVLKNAADVILVDITPDELIQRLYEGKVYVPETAKWATQNFFTPRNLTALRELALRRTAERVDGQMVDYLHQSAIEGPWATSERLLVCVGPDISSELVVREAASLASNLNASWTALYVERTGEEEHEVERAKRIDDALRLAERLGGKIERLSGYDLAGEVLRFARRENITQIVLGRSRAGFIARLLRRSLSEEVVRRSTDIAVFVMMDDQAKPVVERRQWRRPKRVELWAGIGGAVLSVAGAVGVGHVLDHWLRLPNLSMIFLVAVVYCGVVFGLWSAIATAILSFFAFGFFFTEPRYEFTVSEPQEFLALVVFLVVAVITGSLAGRMREQSLRMRARVLATQSLFEFSREMSGAANLDEVLWASAVHAQKTLDARCIVLLIPNDSDLHVSAAWPPVDQLDPGETAAARWALERSEPAGWRTGTLPNVRFQFRPLTTTRGTVGVCGIKSNTPEQPLSTENERTLTSIIEQTATAALVATRRIGESRCARAKRKASHDAFALALA
jgi:two-component system sensor histidine kinase KdpD